MNHGEARRSFATVSCAVICGLILLGTPSSVLGQEKDYLSGIEADKIRDAETTNERIRLFLSFASDRIKKLQYELARPSTDRRRPERLTGLLKAYVGCMDDASELIDLGREKQEDIRDGVKQMQARAMENLAYLEKLAVGGPELKSYRFTLEDAILGTKEALDAANKVAKEYSPPPIRRKP